jgi:glycerophosphoryl diester phosphodiesterase
MKKQHILKQFALVSIVILQVLNAAAQDRQLNTFHIKSAKDLKKFFAYSPDRIPLICGHRGGAQELYPENSIAGLEYVLTKIPAFFEVDPRLTKDSVAVVLHDATLDRTTNGTGKLSDYTWEEVKRLKLKDKKGKPTNYGVHTLDEVLQWAKGKTILMIDKKDVPLNQLYQIIARNKAESSVLISAYTPEEAAFYHQKDKNLMFEVFIKNTEQLKAFEATGVPLQNMVAYFGQPKKRDFYDKLHQKGVMCIVYTAKVIEKQKDKSKRVHDYKDAIDGGADILLTDNALEVAEAIREFQPAKSTKSKFIRYATSTKQ